MNAARVAGVPTGRGAVSGPDPALTGWPREAAGSWPSHPRLIAAGDERLMLGDGRCVRVRPVRAGDAEGEQAFVVALSPQSRRSRFHGALKQLPEPVLRAMTAVDFQQHVAIVAEAGCSDGAARLVADARYVLAEEGQGGAEFAVAVADDWQGLGLGSALLQRLAQHARARGLGRLHGRVLVDNSPMLGLMRRLGARLRNDPFDASIVQVSVLL